MQGTQYSGSEVMGLMAVGYRLAPGADSLKTCLPDRLRHSCFLIMSILYHVREEKSNVFVTKIRRFYPRFL